jgi:hypothetical protein
MTLSLKIGHLFVTPAKAGVYLLKDDDVDSRLRGNDR